MEKGLIVHTIIYNEKNEILILERSKENKTLPLFWDIPGGTLEDGEKPEDGALREINEETNLKVDKPILFYSFSNIDVKKNKQFITLIFLAKYLSGKTFLNKHEHSNYKWLTIGGIEKYNTVPYMKFCLKELLDRKLI